MTFTARTVFLILLFLSSRSFAQTPFYKTYTLPGGAVAPTINCLYQESRGYILVGATTGLYRFDGVSFQKVQAEKNVPTDVTSICETKDGKTWIGFGDGKLGWLQQHQLVLQNPEEGHPTKAIKKIIQDSAGVVWIATAGEGLYYYKDKQFYNINTDDGLSDDYVYDVMADNTGVVAATDRGINLCSVKDKKHIKQYTTTDGLQDNIVRCLASRNKDIYYGTDDGGIGIVYRQNSTTPGFAYNRNWPRGKVNAILISGQHLWIGYNDGVYKAGLSTDPGAHEDIPERLVKHLDLVITHFLQDAEGNTWAASNDQLIRTNGSKLQSLISLPAAEAANTHTLLIDRDDHLWMNVREGLRHLEKDPSGQWKERIYRLPVTINSQITALYEDKFENIWIGTMGNGAFILDPANGNFRKITENKVLQSASVLSITGKNDHVWLASLEGATLARLTEANNDINHPLSIESITTIGGIGTNYIYNIFVDSKDRTWFATDGKGIAMLDKGQITNYGQAQGLKSEVAYRVAEDPQGTIWFTTFNGGLVKFDGNQFRHYGLAEGLSDLNITSLVPDGNGNLYVVHKSGIDIIDTKTGAISYLDAEQGLRDINTDLNAVAAGSNGDIYFIANDAVYRYTSSLAKAQPRITIDRIQLFLNDADVRDGHVFSASEDNISFYYTGLFYSQPGKIQYQYKLEGYGEDWITTNDRRKDFPKLPPGNYTFRVKASLNGNFENAPEASFRFTIQKPVWMRWWFVLLCLTLLGIVLYWYIKDREKRLQKWERLEKEKIQSQFETLRNQVNPHFLFNSFNTLVSEIEEDPKRAVQYVEHMADFFRSIVTYREKDIIPLSEEINIIKDYLFIQRKRYGDAFRVHINISTVESQQYSLAPLTLQLLAENAIKHNSILKEDPLLLEVFIEADQLVVRNNIKPKLHPEKSAGLGLQNIQRRYELLTKKMVMISNDDEYFTVIIPLVKKSDDTSTDHRR